MLSFGLVLLFTDFLSFFSSSFSFFFKPVNHSLYLLGQGKLRNDRGESKMGMSSFRAQDRDAAAFKQVKGS